MSTSDFMRAVEPDSRRERILIGVGVVLAGLFLLADQATKIAVERLFQLHESVPVIDGFFSLCYVINRGAAWGILENRTWLLLGIALAAAVAALVFLRRLTEEWPERYIAVFLVLSGIFGNSIDRIWRTGVVDFLDFYIGRAHWPAFNVADSCICVGVGIFILSNLLRPPHKKSDSAKD